MLCGVIHVSRWDDGGRARGRRREVEVAERPHRPSWLSECEVLVRAWSVGWLRVRAQDRDLRIENKQCEGVWRASPSLGEAAEVFWGLTGSYGGNYGPPSGYNFDMNNDNAIPVQDDPRLHDYNVQARVDGFVDACLTQANNTRGKHIMLTMGSDFQYEQAFEWFDNLDKLIHHTNLDGRVKVFYSNPLKYMEAKHAENITWQRKTDDFFPYADSADAYWTGYFTSRAGLKVLWG